MQYLINTKRRFFTGLCAVLMFIVVYFGFTGSAQAGTLAYIQASVDLSNWEILTAVVRENIGLTAHSPEVRRVDSSTLQSLASNSSSLGNSLSALSGLSSYVTSYDNNSSEYEGKKVNGNIIGGILGSGEQYRVLTFPGKGGKSQTNDFNKATAVNDALIYDLNQAFTLWLDANGYTRTPKLADFYNRMTEFLNSITISGDECTVPGVDGSFTWRMAKGYTSSNHDPSLINISEDAEYVNWGMLVYEGFNNFLLEGDEAVTEQTVYSATPGQLEKSIVAILSSLLDGLRSILGLWTTDELIFNAGGRSHGYVGGIFPNGWEPVIWTLFIIAEVLAAMVLMYGIINNVLKKATSTLNTFARLRAMQQVQDIIVCAIALALLPLLLRIVISMSSDFVDMIYSIIPTNNMTGEKMEISKLVSRYSTGGGTIGGCVAQFLYFGIQVYFNFFYMLRSLMIALLIIIAPIMVSMIMISDAKKQMTVLWGKELLANILIQPIHAFIIATILLLPNSSHGFDNMIAIYAMIPLTSALRNMFFGGSGGLIDQAANVAKNRFTGSVSRATLFGTGAAVGYGANKIGSFIEGKKGDEKGNGSSSTASGSSRDSGNNDLGKEGINNRMNANTQPDSNANSSNDNELSNSSDGVASGNTVTDNTNMGTGTESNSSGSKMSAGTAMGSMPKRFNIPKFGNLRQGISDIGNSKAGKVAKGVVTGAMVGALGVGMATLGGAVEGAGIPSGRSITSLGMGILSAKPKSKGNKEPDGNNSGSNGNGRNRERADALSNAINPSMPPDLSKIPVNTGAIELGRNNSGFQNMGDVSMKSGKNDSIVKRRYYADNIALDNMGISNIKDNMQEMSFTANTTKSPEAAELGAYADYCQYLENNGRGSERDELQKNTGISATRTDNSDNVQVTVNKANWRQARNDGERKYQQDGANIRLSRDYKSQDITGMYIEGKKGSDLSFTGGIKENDASDTGQSSRIASFSEVMKNPGKYDPKQYTTEPDKNLENNNSARNVQHPTPITIPPQDLDDIMTFNEDDFLPEIQN